MPEEPHGAYCKTTAILVSFIKGYRLLISPWLGYRCRFYPSCSTYAEEALWRFGPFKGLYLAARRLLRCHPFHPGGSDPVPPLTRNPV